MIVGWILTGIGLAGAIACLAALIATGRSFARQRERLLENIEEEQEDKR